MDVRRIRPLLLPPHPRRNQYIPSSEETRSIPFPRFSKKPRKLHIRSFLLPLQIEPASLGFDLVKNNEKKLAPFRFRGLRKGRENFISAPSFFLSKTKGKLSFSQRTTRREGNYRPEPEDYELKTKN